MKCHINGKEWNAKSSLLIDPYRIDFHINQDTIKNISLASKRYNSDYKVCFGHDRIMFDFPVNTLIDNFEAPFTVISDLKALYFNGGMKNSEINKYNASTPYEVISYPSTQAELTITSITRLEDCTPNKKDGEYLYVESNQGYCFVLEGTFSFSGTNSFNETKDITNGKFRVKDYSY